MFESSPQPYYEITLYTDNVNYYEVIDLPRIISPSNNKVSAIRLEDIKLYRATSKKFDTLIPSKVHPVWLGRTFTWTEDNSIQTIKFTPVGSVIDMTKSDSGLYQYDITLIDDMGYERVEIIRIFFSVISVQDVFSLSLEELAQRDTDLTLQVTQCKLREITKTTFIFIGDDYYYKELFDNIVVPVIEFDLKSQIVDLKISETEGSEIT